MKLCWVLGLFSCLVTANAQFITTDQNRFAANLYQAVTKSYWKNLVISPISVETVLALIELGTQGETADELRSVLSLPDNPQEISSIFSNLITNMSNFVTFANKLFVETDYLIKEDFLNDARNYFQADVENLDFSKKKEAARTINNWIEQKTNGKITKMVQRNSLGRDTKVILVNALYFMASWETKFHGSMPWTFHTSSSNSKSAGFLMNTAFFNYFDSPELNAQFLELPYQGNNSMSMVVVLPKDIDGLAELESNIHNVLAVKQWTNKAVSVLLPKFKIENKINMKKILYNMGIKKIFSTDADLSGIAGIKGELMVSRVVQKTFISVDEEGTEAAAATEAAAVARSFANIQFFANHPFLFYIQSQGTILYMGRYVEPDIEDNSVDSEDPTTTPVNEDNFFKDTSDEDHIYFPDR